MRIKVSTWGFTGPMLWSWYPEPIQLVEFPRVSATDKGCEVSIVVRCDPEVGKKYGFIPLNKPKEEKLRLVIGIGGSYWNEGTL
jgi:hypothetical protein